jgi:peptide-methionine (S)-S-oxide reductase
MSWLGKLGLGGGGSPRASEASAALAQGPDEDKPAVPGNEFAQFGAGCFWGVELVFQRVPGVTRTEVGYSQGALHDPTYEDVCTGATGHNEVVRVQYDPAACKFDDLLDAFWAKHDPTTPNRQVRHSSSAQSAPAACLDFTFSLVLFRLEVRIGDFVFRGLESY